MTVDRLLARLAALERERAALRAELRRLRAGAGGGQAGGPAGRGGPVTTTVRCRCGTAIRVAGGPGVDVAILRHGEDPRALALYDDDPLRARALAGDPALLDEPVVRGWLRGVHPAPD